MKKILIIIASIVGILALASIALPIVFEKNIRLKAEQEIDKQVDATVSFDRISLSLFKHFPNLTLSLHDLTILGKEEFTGDTLASIKEAAIELNLLNIIKGKETEVKSIHLTRPVLDIRVLKNGKANYDIFASDTTATADTTSTLNVALDKIIIKNGTVIYDDQSLDTYIEAHGLDYKGQGDFVKDIFDLKSEATVSKFTFDYGSVRYLYNKFVDVDMLMEMNLKDYKFTFKENTFLINHFKFGIDGFFTMLENGYDMDLKFKTQETAFKNILSLIPGVYMEDIKQIQTQGNLAFDGFVKGIYSDSSDRIPAFHMNMKVVDGMFKVDTLPEAVKNIRIDLALDNKYGIMDSTIIDLKDFYMDMGEHPFRGRIKVEGLKNYKIDADVFADLNLEDLERMYPIRGLDLKGKVNFELKTKGVLVQDANNNISNVPPFHLNLKLENGKIKYDSLPAAIENIQFHLIADNATEDIENTVLQFKSIHLDMDKNPIHGYATIKGYENYDIDADIDAKLDLADIERLFPVKGVAMKGLFDLDVNAKGMYNSSEKKFPAIDAKMNLTDGWLKTEDYPEPIENIHFIAEAMNSTGDYRDTKLNIVKLTYMLEEEPFSVQGSITDMVDYAYDLKVHGKVDLAKITKIYPVEGMTLSGIIDSDIETIGRVSDLEAGRYKKIKSDGTIEIKDLMVHDASMPVDVNVKDALIAFTPEKIVLQNLIGKIGKSRIQLKGDLANYMALLPGKHTHNGMHRSAKKLITGDMVLTCDTLDLDEFMPQNSTDNVSAVSTSGSKDTTIAVAWRVPENFDFTFDSKIKYVKYQDVHITGLDGEIRIKDGILSLTETGFNTLDAEFMLTGDYNTQDINHPLFDFDLDIKELDINRAYREIKLVRDLAPAASDAYGIFSVTYKLKGELDQAMNVKTPTLLGSGEIRIANAKINGMKIFEEISKTAKRDNINDPHLKDFVMDTEIKNNKIYVKPFALKVSGFDTDIEGVSDLAGTMQYIFKIQLLPFDKLKIPFHVSGTYDNPKVAIGKGHKLPEE